MNQAKKKVLYLITKATDGGAQKYVYDLATHLPPDEFEPVVAYGQHGRLAEMLQKKEIATLHIPALGRDVSLISDVSSFFQILRHIQLERPSVLHVNSSKAAALGALATHIARIPRIIFTVHGWPFKESRNSFARTLIYFVSWFTSLLSHATIVVSKSDEAQGKRMWNIGQKIHYIPIGIETPSFLSREEASAFLSISTTAPRIVTIAELTANKGIRYAIEAIALLKNRGVYVSYIVIGDGEEREYLQALAQKLDVANRLSFLGFVPDASKYLKAFDIFLLPSLKEGMPYVLLEAAAAGLPIITTSVVNPDVIERFQNIRTVPPADPEAIAEALLEAMRARSKTGFFPTNNHFSLSEMLKKTIELY